ncbi:MAG: glycosyltransferase [Bacteriovoracaceae bacterium]|nr:glycosyltransferase [Bacteriovoracaceae bacterium]
MNNKSNKSLVSIIIATYNRSDIIERTIASALNQTYSNIEVIVVDDGSTDNTRSILENNDSINYIYQDNQERGAARNTGIKSAGGDYIVIMDSDDLLANTMIEKCITPFLEKNNHYNKPIGVVYGQTHYIDTNDNPLGICYNRPPPEGDVLLDIAEKPCLPVTALVKKDCFDSCGLFKEDRALSGSEDYELWFRISKIYSFKYVDTPVLYYRIHTEQTACDPAKNYKNMMLAHDFIYSDGPVIDKIIHLKQKNLSWLYFFTANNYYEVNNRKCFLFFLMKALIAYPPILFQGKPWKVFLKIFMSKKTLIFIRRFLNGGG